MNDSLVKLEELVLSTLEILSDTHPEGDQIRLLMLAYIKHVQEDLDAGSG